MEQTVTDIRIHRYSAEVDFIYDDVQYIFLYSIMKVSVEPQQLSMLA